ncbi:beta-fructofuranosidase/levanase/fructan beta-fructosidase [Arcticibacter pallidicorallinus]|uniref:Beta-fructofuranosidase/levanase/fructan beta-fructosidase n=2 Tax=Arcticibacter pallidicorallinus TaxID=1259464 RepID=A0A2T0UCA2_9SPHI|nr:beta-fructofuranosidase/levanase/fructan beta-fructosidase [Arcticibacter pallidicorallinus]
MGKVFFRSSIYTILMFTFLVSDVNGQQNSSRSREEKYRPQYHFSPEKGWIGDPDGLVIHRGKFHLFWWGHAVSEDLVHWKELPPPMKGDDKSFSYFSGSVAVDLQNTSGFGKNSMVAVYTRHFAGDSLPETQALSISKDDGLVFNYYAENPVLDIGKVFFRDPQVFWYPADKLWKMVVALPDVQQIHIYESRDLKSWQFCSTFTGLGAQNSFWECPDLFELPVLNGKKEKKWVMLIGRGPNRVQYFVGDFDGKTFTSDTQTASFIKTGKGLDGEVYDDFEAGHESKWSREGTAFSKNTGSKELTDYLGKSYIGSVAKEGSIGRMKSAPFLIKQKAINFLIAGGDSADSTGIRLIVDGKVVRSSTGDNSKVLKWNGWDVRNLAGKRAYLEILDLTTDTISGSIAIDHIVFSDQLLNQRLEHALWLDYGSDYYATRTWRNYDESKALGDTVFAIGWMGNWDYARKAPTSWGKGFESLPRTMALKRTGAGYRIVQQPVPQLQKLRQALHESGMQEINGIQKLETFRPSRNTYEMEVEFKASSDAAFGLFLLEGEGRKLVLRYDPVTSEIRLDRTNCTDFVSDSSFNELFAKEMSAPLKLDQGKLRLHIFVDQSSIEVFTNDGEVVLSATTFPSDGQLGISLFSERGKTQLTKLKAWELNSIWK